MARTRVRFLKALFISLPCGDDTTMARLTKEKVTTGMNWASVISTSQLKKKAQPGESSENVGMRLAKLRKLFGLSQRELARRAGLTNGTISSIELNLTSPQIGSLRKILAVFPISIADFFSMEVEESQQIFFRKGDLVEMGVGGISLRVAGTQNRSRKIQLCYEHYVVGADTGEEMLMHEGEEAGFVIRGELEVTVGYRKTVLKAGDAYYFPSTIPHRFRNAGERECEVVSAATPPSF